MAVNAKASTCIDFDVENSDKDPKSKVGNHVRISKCSEYFARDYTSNWSKEVFVIKKLKNCSMDICNT